MLLCSLHWSLINLEIEEIRRKKDSSNKELLCAWEAQRNSFNKTFREKFTRIIELDNMNAELNGNNHNSFIIFF